MAIAARHGCAPTSDDRSASIASKPVRLADQESLSNRLDRLSRDTLTTQRESQPGDNHQLAQRHCVSRERAAAYYREIYRLFLDRLTAHENRSFRSKQAPEWARVELNGHFHFARWLRGWHSNGGRAEGASGEARVGGCDRTTIGGSQENGRGAL